MSIPSKRKLWSVLTYDLRTAIDVCGVPCLIKTSARAMSDDLLLPLSTKIKIEKELVIYTAHVRVIDYDNPDWIMQTKGCGFYDDRRQFIGCELLIPLSYPGLVKLYQNKKTKTYFNISEVAEDFPHLVRVEQEVACVSPGVAKIQVLRKGTLLKLDRLTKSTKMIRGMSETFLMFFEVGTGKEYGFSLLSAVHFTEVVDTFKYTLKEIIDQLPLPRRVQFVAVNPHDVIVVDDDEALELLTVLGGPIEIIGMRRLEILVGLYLNDETDRFEMVVIPKDDSLSDNMLVHIPSSCLVDNDKTFADREILERTNQDLLMDKLYALYVDDITPVFLKNDITIQGYDVSDIAYAPPLPPRRYDSSSLTTAQSDPQINDADKCDISRKRFRSLGDVRHKGNKREETEEDNGVRGFFNSMSRRLTRRGSKGITGSPSETTANTLLNRVSSLKQYLGLRKSPDNTSKPPGAFVCYLNCSENLSIENDSERESSHSVNSEATSEDTDDANVADNKDFTYLDDNVSINTLSCNADHESNGMFYASVSWKSKDYGVVEVRERFCCDICKTNFLIENGNKENDDKTTSSDMDLVMENKSKV